MKSRTLAVDIPQYYPRLYMDFVCGKVSGLDPAHESFSVPGAWPALAEQALSGCRATPGFWGELKDYNSHLGASTKVIENIRELAGGGCAAVIGGQQPGLLGGALLVLYKAATIVAAAEHFREVTGIPCAPIYIVSGDDSDFVEAKKCTLYNSSLKRLSIEYSGEGYRTGQMVGTLSAQEEKDLAGSLLDSVADMPGTKFVEGLIESSGDSAQDHGELVGAMLSGLFSNEGLIILEGRSEEMRRAGRELFESYLSRREELAVAVRAKGKELESRGYHAQLSGPGLDWWLFMVEEDLRKKSGGGGIDGLRRAAAESPGSLTPNVALRPLWRDSTLPTVFSVLGAGEVAYTLQLSEAYRMLGVPARGIFPRLSVTLMPDETIEIAGGWKEDSHAALLSDYEGVSRSHYRRLMPDAAVKALDGARSAVGGSMGELERALSGMSEKWGKAARSVGHANEKGLSRLESEMLDALKRDAEKANPRLKGLGDFLLPDGKLQERTVSILMPLLWEGASFVEDVMALAREHVKACTLGNVRHYCYGLCDEPAVRKD